MFSSSSFLSISYSTLFSSTFPTFLLCVFLNMIMCDTHKNKQEIKQTLSQHYFSINSSPTTNYKQESQKEWCIILLMRWLQHHYASWKNSTSSIAGQKILPGNKIEIFFLGRNGSLNNFVWQTLRLCCFECVFSSFRQTGFSSIITGSVMGLPVGGAGPVDRMSIKHET